MTEEKTITAITDQTRKKNSSNLFMNLSYLGPGVDNVWSTKILKVLVLL